MDSFEGHKAPASQIGLTLKHGKPMDTSDKLTPRKRDKPRNSFLETFNLMFLLPKKLLNLNLIKTTHKLWLKKIK